MSWRPHQESEPVVNQEESNVKLPSCVHYQESDNGSLSSTRVVLDLKELSKINIDDINIANK